MNAAELHVLTSTADYVNASEPYVSSSTVAYVNEAEAHLSYRAICTPELRLCKPPDSWPVEITPL